MHGLIGKLIRTHLQTLTGRASRCRSRARLIVSRGQHLKLAWPLALPPLLVNGSFACLCRCLLLNSEVVSAVLYSESALLAPLCLLPAVRSAIFPELTFTPARSLFPPFTPPPSSPPFSSRRPER